MDETIRPRSLTKDEIKEVQAKAREKLSDCKKEHDVIGTQIFSILSLNARVFYYPLGKAGPWGITYMWGNCSDIVTQKPFIAINTSIAEDAQVFAAAHELYHIWFDQRAESISTSILSETNGGGVQLDDAELKANRFAAEFLVDERILQQEMRIYSIDQKSVGIRDILQLSALFTVPYRTIVKRLNEINIINKNDCTKLLGMTERDIEQLRKKFGIPINNGDERIIIDNLVELAVSMYDQKRITYEKLQYLLSISSLTPNDIGVTEPKTFYPLSDDELDAIL